MTTSTFDGKVCVVTGAGSGLGRALAEGLARQGASLALSDIDTAGLAETTSTCLAYGVGVREDKVDVTDYAAMLAHAEEVAEEFGGVNQIYNNAGVAYFGTVLQSEIADVARVMDVNYWGVVHGTKAFLPHLITSGDGHVINISSLFGLLSVSGQSAYNAAKFAVRGFTEALAQEMYAARIPVRVTCVHPGGIKTAVARNAVTARDVDSAAIAQIFDTKLARHTADNAAETILNGVSKRRTRVLVGSEAHALDALVRLMGPSYQRLLVRANPFGA
ncbi:SDR family NAD(P)-dependent oxidoreductase [Mycobacterium sp. 134]|uniref:SDR family NAD(P)-dependent oxidoreductase n=1 Tax=unclassified Mycobacterium TaxID=2642494 RepID=UPI0007FE06A1|nr:SDR family NAD(P)-dependent oxidoreductase [Mycobacterium sp. E802]OBG83431.1 acetoin dehydrogenase [Mycobacterium sp. E802]